MNVCFTKSDILACQHYFKLQRCTSVGIGLLFGDEKTEICTHCRRASLWGWLQHLLTQPWTRAVTCLNELIFNIESEEPLMRAPWWDSMGPTPRSNICVSHSKDSLWTKWIRTGTGLHPRSCQLRAQWRRRCSLPPAALAPSELHQPGAFC